MKSMIPVQVLISEHNILVCRIRQNHEQNDVGRKILDRILQSNKESFKKDSNIINGRALLV